MPETLIRTQDPYLPAFEAIETEAYSTADAYASYAEFVGEQEFDPCIYLSMALTSGGYARDQSLSFADAYAKNAGHGELIADVVVQQHADFGISRSDIVVPSALGKVPGWGQSDYLLFWGHVITGLEPILAREIDHEVRASGAMERPGFNDKGLSTENRWIDYKRLIDAYVDSLDGLPTPFYPRNMQAIMLILDAELSLGVNAERYLGYRLGIGEYAFNVDSELGLEPDLAAVRSIGATTLSEGDPSLIFGRHDIETSLQRRAAGQIWQKSGILSGILDRREGEVLAAQAKSLEGPDRTSEELWRDYYESK